MTRDWIGLDVISREIVLSPQSSLKSNLNYKRVTFCLLLNECHVIISKQGEVRTIIVEIYSMILTSQFCV